MQSTTGLLSWNMIMLRWLQPTTSLTYQLWNQPLVTSLSIQIILPAVLEMLALCHPSKDIFCQFDILLLRTVHWASTAPSLPVPAVWQPLEPPSASSPVSQGWLIWVGAALACTVSWLGHLPWKVALWMLPKQKRGGVTKFLELINMN